MTYIKDVSIRPHFTVFCPENPGKKRINSRWSYIALKINIIVINALAKNHNPRKIKNNERHLSLICVFLSDRLRYKHYTFGVRDQKLL